MAFDEELVERIRGVLVDEPDLTEKKMFGGLGFIQRLSLPNVATQHCTWRHN